MWFFLALGCAIAEFAKDLTSKRAFKVLDEYYCSTATILLAVPWLGIAAFFEQPTEISFNTFIVAPVAASLHIAAIVFYFRAIRAADLSLVLPLVSFTPMFYIFTSPIIIGEYPSPTGILGIIFIVVGSYLLNFNARREGLLAPFKLLLSSVGARSMLATAFLWSITGNIDRIGIASSGLFTWFFILITHMALGLVILTKYKSKISWKDASSQKPALFGLGFLHAVSTTFYMLAINLTLVAYVVSVKRLSVVFSVLWGGLMLKEDNISQRIPATLFMLLGVLIISLGS